MKRELTILVFLLAACGSVRSTTTNPAPTNILSISATPNPLVRIKSFVFNSECPQLCWLDIHPGVTTYDASKPLLSNSPQIIQSSTIDEPFVRTKVKWNPGGFPVYVDIHFEKGIVSTIQFVGPAIATMNDMINLIGKPEEISINIEHSPDSTYGVYAIRYPVSRTIIESEFINLEGPDPSNYIKYMVINGGLEDYKSIYSTTHEQEFQKWLGFGHLEDYLRSTNSLTTIQPTNPASYKNTESSSRLDAAVPMRIVLEYWGLNVIYGHLSRSYLNEMDTDANNYQPMPGDKIKPGQEIGLTGTNRSPHLHLGFSKNAQTLFNPM